MTSTTPQPTPTGSTPASPPGGEQKRARTNHPVLWGSALLIAAMALWALLAPTQAGETIGVIVGWISTWFGPWYFVLGAAVLVFSIVVAAGRTGKIRLGPDHSKPQFRFFTWAAMLFAAGIGTDLMFYAVAEPAAQYLAPPVIEGGSVEAAREAVVWTLFHYGHIGWGMYALMGMALAYFTYRRGMPLSMRSVLHPIFGDRVWGKLGHVIDIAAILGSVFGLAVTLGIGVSMLSRGLSIITGWEDSMILQIALMVIAVVMATISTISGVSRGVRRLSEIQAVLSFVLLGYILVTGRTDFLLNGLVMNVGDYIADFASLTLDTMAFTAPVEWMNAWTLFFWAWWVAWAPFVGLFLARISRGRTIREFVLGTLTLPFIFVLLWASIFGNATLDIIRGGSDENLAFGELAMNDPAGGLFGMLENYPLATFTIILAVIVGLLFFVTSMDSGALVLARLSSDPRSHSHDAAPWLRVLWAVLTGLLTLGMLLAGGIPTLQSATMIMGLPFSVVLLGTMIAFWKTIRRETMRLDAGQASFHSSMAGRGAGGGWRRRLAQLVTFPGAKATKKFAERVCAPALRAVGKELTDRGMTSEVDVSRHVDDIPCLALTVRHEGAPDFRYELVPTKAPMPSFASKAQNDAIYYRMEVHLAEGAQGYDVEGWTEEQVIDDVLDAYDRHLSFLHTAALPTVETAPEGS